MFIIHSMTDVAIWITVAVVLQLLFLQWVNPLLTAGAFIRHMITSPKYAIHFIITLGILFMDKAEQWVAHHIHYHANFTSTIYSLEGNLTAKFQSFFLNHTLTVFSSFFYIAIFPSLMITSILIYTYQRNLQLFYAVCYAIMFNYFIAIPFYLFFPVNEVWSFNPHIHFLVVQVLPTFETVYRPLSALQNCFPSLHTSISVSMAAIALSTKNKLWKYFSTAAAAFIMFSVLYLGVHWLSDVTAGLLLGIASGRIGILISQGKINRRHFLG